jgi:hypothetical protein
LISRRRQDCIEFDAARGDGSNQHTGVIERGKCSLTWAAEAKGEVIDFRPYDIAAGSPWRAARSATPSGGRRSI